MLNSLINYDETLESEDFKVKDYTSKDLNKIRNIDEIKYLTQDIEIQDDQTIESKAWEFYENSSYWDILILLNNRECLFEMPFSYDIIVKITERLTEKLKNMQNTVISEQAIKRFYERNLRLREIQNIKFKNIKAIQKDKITDFFKLVNIAQDNFNNF